MKNKKSASYFAAEALVLQNVKSTIPDVSDRQYYEEENKTACGIFKEIEHCLRLGLSPESEEVQTLVEKHFIFTMRFHYVTKAVYKALAHLYQEHPAFREQLDPFHPHLAEFLGQAMRIYANSFLK